MKLEDIDNDQKTSLLGFTMVLVMWLTGKKYIDENDAKILESILFLIFSFYTNRRNNYTRKDDNQNT